MSSFVKLGTVVSLLVLCFAGQGVEASQYHDGPWNRKKCGLTDLQGREIVPAIYQHIYYVGNGLFWLSQTGSDPTILVNRKGVRLKLEVPAKSTFTKVLWLGQKAENERDFVPTELADDALLVFGAEQNFGICDKAGNVILPALFSWIDAAREGKSVVRTPDNQLFVFDVHTKKQKKIHCEDINRGIGMTFNEGLAPFRTKSGYGFVDADGNVAIEPKYNWAMRFVDGRAYVHVLSDDGKKAFGAFINKAGTIVSPPDLRVSESFGGYSVATVVYSADSDRSFR